MLKNTNDYKSIDIFYNVCYKGKKLNQQINELFVLKIESEKKRLADAG